MAIVKLAPGQAVLVAAVKEGDHPDQGLPPGEVPVDPGYGVDVGLGPIKPSHPIVLPPGGIPTHPIELPPPEPVDPAYGIDEDQGYLKPSHPIALPGKPELGWELKTVWSPVTGWIVVAVPTGEHVTPSKTRR